MNEVTIQEGKRSTVNSPDTIKANKKRTRTNLKKTGSIQKTALVRIKSLLSEAALTKNSSLAKKYVIHARKISMKTKTSFPKSLKKRFCKNCSSYLVPGRNLRVRLQKKKLVYLCLDCKKIKRYGFSHKNKSL